MIVVVISANDRPDSIDLLGSKQTGQVGVYEPLELTNMTHLYTVSSNQYKTPLNFPRQDPHLTSHHTEHLSPSLTQVHLQYEGEPVDDVEDEEENWKGYQEKFVNPEREY